MVAVDKIAVVIERQVMYRDPLVHKQLEKKLTTCNWYITSRNGMPNAETVILPEREVQMSPHTSTAQDNSAIERSWPKSIFHTV